MGVIVPKLRASARGQQCTLQIPGVCLGGTETTILAHIRDEAKGMGNKANDWSACFSCAACHRHLDERRLGQFEATYCLRAYQRTIKFWIENGYLVIPGVLTKQPKPSKKTVPRTSLFARQP